MKSAGAGIILAGLLALGGCAANLNLFAEAKPPLARGHEFTFGNADSEWTAVLRQAFPPGTTEVDLVARLHREHFEIDRADRTAHYDWSAGEGCRRALDVSWRADSDGVVSQLDGAFYNACT